MNGPDITWHDLIRSFWGGHFAGPGPNGESILMISDRPITMVAFRGCVPVFSEVETKHAEPALRLLPGENP